MLYALPVLFNPIETVPDSKQNLKGTVKSFMMDMKDKYEK